MFVKTVLGALAGAALINAAWAEDGGDWVTIAETQKSLWQGKKGSGALSNVDGKKNSGYKYLYQVRNKSKNTFDYAQAVVLLDACRKGFGYVYYNGMEGQFLGKDQFVRFGPTVADNLGSTACQSWDNDTGKVSLAEKGDSWEFAAQVEKSGNKVFLKRDTLRKRAFKGKPSVSILSRFDNLREKTYEYSEFVIASADCERGYGTLYELNFDGGISDKWDIALNGDSVASVVGGVVCNKR
ncbi:hypothetical protein [Pandoraea bronchicola]|uniref:Uncharacterized protein n=1 Tax=Pandoraea bronchicola TaxID=2508287 RepID=A0A5E5BQS4_9BURK|nr:hypothetical protein [Pandoraea bronchicola]VVE87656.1 hypothetical protein PBR20603_01593 [Pandoraea bronchicola]